MEGTRPLLVEVQALVASTEVVPPRRVANGIDRNRLAMVLAVLARHGGPSLSGADVFVNVAGGVRVGEPLADPEHRPLACFGEVGLTGELRPVAHADRRIAEALKFGLGPVLCPAPTELPAGTEPHAALASALRRARRGAAERAA